MMIGDVFTVTHSDSDQWTMTYLGPTNGSDGIGGKYYYEFTRGSATGNEDVGRGTADYTISEIIDYVNDGYWSIEWGINIVSRQHCFSETDELFIL